MHARSWHLLSKLFTPSIESILELLYGDDYNVHKLGLPHIRIQFPVEIASTDIHVIMFETDGIVQHQVNSSLAEIETCDVDLNRTNKTTEDIKYGLPNSRWLGWEVVR
ncbi:hypothetical protein MHU86_20575 [Fragilaria crotonensis]|nr:hypothetical protein MHU86_20575 [Fragilaria crotonensis]